MIPVVFILSHFRRPLMVLKSAFVAVVCTGLLALAGPATAAEYRQGEFFRLDLSKALLSPKRIGPEARFAPLRIEARSDEARSDETSSDSAEADLDASVWPKLPPHKVHVAKTRVEKTHIEKPRVEKRRAEPPRAGARTNLAKRRGNPLDAQARDTRIQTWPCRSGGICNWR
jgi:hypothetical protein